MLKIIIFKLGLLTNVSVSICSTVLGITNVFNAVLLIVPYKIPIISSGNVSVSNFLQLLKLLFNYITEPLPPMYFILVKYLNSSKYYISVF